MTTPKKSVNLVGNDEELGQDEGSTSTILLRGNLSSNRSLQVSSEFIHFPGSDQAIENSRPTVSRNASETDESYPKQKTKDSSWGSGLHDDIDFGKKRGHSAISKRNPSVPSFLEATSWELWWIQSQLWNRVLILLLFILFVIFMMQCSLALFFLTQSIQLQVPNPHVCRTAQCSRMSSWLRQSMNQSVSPCDNFYEFMCGGHKGTDKGNVPFKWYDSFGRLEADGDSVLVNLTQKSDDPLLKQTLMYYQSCSDLRRRKQTGLSVLSTILKDLFQGFNLWDDTKEPRLEVIASRIVKAIGDYGLFSLREPINHPELYYERPDEFHWIQSATASSLSPILPFIYDGLDIPSNKRGEITTDVLHMIATLNSLIFGGKPDSCEVKESQYKHYLDLNFPVWDVFLGQDSIVKELIPGTKLYRWKLKPGEESKIKLTIFPTYLTTALREKRHQKLIQCWNSLMQRISVENIRAVYVTFWSLRVFSEILEEVDTETVNKLNLLHNPLVSDTQKEFLQRRLQSRCFESLQKQMGYIPLFRLFKSIDINKYLEQVNGIINMTANGLLRFYKPPEEGGIPLMSTFYRERVEAILSGRQDTSILIPVKEDDFSVHTEFEVKTTQDHLQNVMAWKRYTLNRKVHYWKIGTPKNKLVWYYSFYQLETVNAFETPGYAAYSILKFPLSIFLHPYWENDLLAANFAGSIYLSIKAWLKLIYFDHHMDNVDQDIDHKKKNRELYTEGTFSDGDYKNCETYLYEDGNQTGNGERVTKVINPHIYAFNHGYEDVDVEDAITQAFYISISIKTAFNMYLKEKERLNGLPYWKLNLQERQHTSKTRISGLETFSDKQLFFMTSGRHFCRSKSKTYEYYSHENRYLAALMSLEEFSEVWKCPPGSGMNPPNKCYGFLGGSVRQ